MEISFCEWSEVLGNLIAELSQLLPYKYLLIKPCRSSSQKKGASNEVASNTYLVYGIEPDVALKNKGEFANEELREDTSN